MNNENIMFLTVSSDDSSSSNESSDSDFEDKLLEKPQPIPKIEGYIVLVVKEYSDITFQSYFRMTRTTAEILIGRLASTNFIPTGEHGGREKISVEESFLLTLWYLVNNETFRQISDRFNVSLSSAHRVLLRVLNFILSLRTQYIRWPTGERVATTVSAFQKQKAINNVLGAIDGCHVRIERPKHHQDAYVNRKGYHSILIQGVVMADKQFSDVYCGEPGSIHDARLLRKSSLYRKAQENPDCFGNKFLVGDSAYPSLPWLVPPFKDNGRLTPNHRLFNYRHSSTRIVVEHSFGLLKGRFRILKHIVNENINTAVKIVMACCVLHNVCIQHNDQSYIEMHDISADINNDAEPWTEYTEGTNRRELVFEEMFKDV